MALKKSMEFKGISVENAYIKVVSPTIHEGNTSMSFIVTYSSGRGGVNFNSMIVQADYSLGGDNPVKQGYARLKAMEEFYGAEDC